MSTEKKATTFTVLYNCWVVYVKTIYVKDDKFCAVFKDSAGIGFFQIQLLILSAQNMFVRFTDARKK